MIILVIKSSNQNTKGATYVYVSYFSAVPNELYTSAVAQWVKAVAYEAMWLSNPEVGGSIPPSHKYFNGFFKYQNLRRVVLC